MARWVTGLLVALTALTLLTVDTNATAASVRPGSLTVRLVGLPSGQSSAAVLRGPDGLRRPVSLRGLTIAKARVGVYRLTLGSVRITRAIGAIKQGALATALRGTVSVRVVAGRRASLEGDYSSIINPGLKALTGGVVSIDGPVTDPSSVTLKGRVALTRGDVISLPPSAMLPDGLLSNVLGVSYASDQTKASVAAASVYEVAPNFQFDVPLTAQSAATVADVQAGCGRVSGITPYVTINGVSFSGGWDTVKVFGLHITDGVQAAVHFTAGAGVNVTAGVGLSCKASVSFSANGMAGPIPVTAGIEGDLDGSAGVGGVLNSGGSIHVDAGAHTIGVPPALVWLPDVSFSDPKFMFNATTFAQATAGIGLAIKAGVGNSDIASVTLNVGASLDFNAEPGSCTWEAKFGQFSAEGTLLGWSISTPQTPALFTEPLWQSACAATGTSTSPPTSGNTAPAAGSPGPTGGTTGPTGEEGAGGAPAEDVSASAGATCSVLEDGAVDCWGDNESGELGDGTTTSSDVPVRVSGITTATQVAVGGIIEPAHACAVLSSGQVQCWGRNDEGVLGDSQFTSLQSDGPVTVTGINTATQVAVADLTTCVLLSSGGVDCWGQNESGELGDGTTDASVAPVPVPGIVNATQIAVGSEGGDVCALLATGHVDCWGNDVTGVLGTGATSLSTCVGESCSTTPVQVSGIANAVQIGLGGNGLPFGRACALLASGTADCWGDNGFGGLGDGTAVGPDNCEFAGDPEPCSAAPVPVSGLADATQLAVGVTTSCAVRSSGQVDCWGYGLSGGLGDGATANSDVPVGVTGVTTATEVGSGQTHSCAVVADGHIDCWGGNASGQLGDGTTTDTAVPVQVVGIP